MKLNILERIGLLQILPQQGSFVTLRIVNDLQNTLGFTENELKENNIKQTDDGRTTWDSNSEKEIPIGEKATEMIAEALKELDEGKKLQSQHYTLYEKFVSTAQ